MIQKKSPVFHFTNGGYFVGVDPRRSLDEITSSKSAICNLKSEI